MSPYKTRKYGYTGEVYRTRHAYARQYGYRSDESIQMFQMLEAPSDLMGSDFIRSESSESVSVNITTNIQATNIKSGDKEMDAGS